MDDGYILGLEEELRGLKADYQIALQELKLIREEVRQKDGILCRQQTENGEAISKLSFMQNECKRIESFLQVLEEKYTHSHTSKTDAETQTPKSVARPKASQKERCIPPTGYCV